MSILEALAELDALARVLPGASNLPAASRCRALADEQGRPEAADIVSRDVVEAVRAELMRACEAGGAQSVPVKTLRDASLAMWHGEPQAASLPGLLDRYLEEAGARARWLGPLIEAWLRDFGPGKTRLAATGRTIAARLPMADHPRISAWREANESFSLFDANIGPRLVARSLLHASEPVADVLRRTGMNDPIRAAGGYFRACVSALLDALPDALRATGAEASWNRAASVLQVARTTRDHRNRELGGQTLRFGDMAGKIANACLAPWLGGPPAAMARDAIQAFLVAAIGDPRLIPQRWADAGEDAASLMRRWLSEATLDAFFALISQRNDDAQWRYREKFWRACFDKAKNAEVWVVLDPGLASWAKTLPVLRESFGSMQGSGARDQAVLLIRIGDLVLSEWSNVGAVRAWDRNDPGCPKLHGRTYVSSALRAPCLDFPDNGGKGGSKDGKGLWHHKPARYVWQRSAAALLLQRVGLRLNQTDYA